MILVYDMTYPESLEGVLNWYKMAKEHMDLDEAVVCLVGNKCDMVEQLMVTNKTAKNFADKIGAQIVMEMSAKNRINIQEFFDQLAKVLLEKHDQRGRSQSVSLGK